MQLLQRLHCLLLKVERDSQMNTEGGSVEDVLLNMLDERDRLVVGLKEAREELQTVQLRLQDIERERDSLRTQLTSTVPSVSSVFAKIVHIIMENAAFLRKVV